MHNFSLEFLKDRAGLSYGIVYTRSGSALGRPMLGSLLAAYKMEGS